MLHSKQIFAQPSNATFSARSKNRSIPNYSASLTSFQSTGKNVLDQWVFLMQDVYHGFVDLPFFFSKEIIPTAA